MTIDIERLKHDLDYWLQVAPEGATHYREESPCPWLRAEPLSYFRKDQWVDYGTCHWGSGHIADAIPRPSPAWDGSGLPPVGVECEALRKGTACWRSFRPVAYDGHYVFGYENGYPDAYRLDLHEFRPLKTEKERVVGAAMKIGGLRARDGAKEVYGALYDAGMLKEPTND